MENNIALSICIPTYNRAEFLRQCLDSIVEQFSDTAVTEKTEVVLCDNGSTDNTEAVIAEYRLQFSNIRYFKNAENLGVDRNILRVTSEAKGEYCWFLGDDDVYFAGALKKVLEVIEKGNADYIMANAWGYDRELKNSALSRPNLHIAADQYFPTLSAFVKTIPDYRDTVGFFGGFSCQIVKRSVWQAAENKEEFIGSQALHMFVILKNFRDLPMCQVAQPLVKTRADNIRWDTFPGLETVAARNRKTKEALVWIYRIYGIKYSKLHIDWYFFWSATNSYFVNNLKRALRPFPKLEQFARRTAKIIFKK